MCRVMSSFTADLSVKCLISIANEQLKTDGIPLQHSLIRISQIIEPKFYIILYTIILQSFQTHMYVRTYSM